MKWTGVGPGPPSLGNGESQTKTVGPGGPDATLKKSISQQLLA